jgi:tRNA-uridine 2-sulfurtransferase
VPIVLENRVDGRVCHFEKARALADLPTAGGIEPGQRIVVAMSGGVDSSVAAALLKAEGHDVIGVTLQLYDHGEATGRKGSCCAGQDIQVLSIPHYVLDYEKRFAAAVIDTFAQSYIAGETPIPCVNCNQDIKFKDLLHFAQDLGATYLATGHYIQKRDGVAGPELLRAVDTHRDQSYFLFATNRNQLSHLLFPIGGLTKAEVRQAALDYKLPVADKPDSQDICFVPQGRYTDVIEKLKPGATQPGDIIHTDGRVLGQHEGTIHYTVGQRRGIRIAAADPLYVIRIDASKNHVIVGPRALLLTRGLVLRDVNWLDDGLRTRATGDSAAVFARIRSTQAPAPATVFVSPDQGINVVLESGEEGIAKGQACVFYDGPDAGARVLGGGWIAMTAPVAQIFPQFEQTAGVPAA